MKKRHLKKYLLVFVIALLASVGGYLTKNWQAYFPVSSISESTNVASENVNELASVEL